MPAEYYTIPPTSDILTLSMEINRILDSISRRLNYISPDGDNTSVQGKRITSVGDATEDLDAINRSQTFVRSDLIIPSRLLQTDTSSELVSVTDLTDFISGTANQVLVTDDTDGTLTLSLPQDIATTSSPTFVGIQAAADLTITTSSTYTLKLSDPVYNDIQFPILTGKVPAAGAPTFEAFTSNTSEYSFAVGDNIDLSSNEVSHSWIEGTAGDLHIHVTTKAANTSGSDQFAKFTAYVARATTGAVWSQVTLTAELTIPTGTAQRTLFYLDMGNVTLTNYTIGSQIKIALHRIAATGGTEYPAKIFVNQCGIHLQEDTIGSRQEGIK